MGSAEHRGSHVNPKPRVLPIEARRAGQYARDSVGDLYSVVEVPPDFTEIILPEDRDSDRERRVDHERARGRSVDGASELEKRT